MWRWAMSNCKIKKIAKTITQLSRFDLSSVVVSETIQIVGKGEGAEVQSSNLISKKRSKTAKTNR